MFSEFEEKAFKVIDEFLLELQSSPKGDSFITYGKPSEFFYAKELMNTHKLITYRIPSSPTSICDISPMGLEVFKKGGMKNYLISVNQSKEEKENLELQQLRTNVEVLTNQHMDYLIQFDVCGIQFCSSGRRHVMPCLLSTFPER